MNTLQLRTASLNDIVFEGRNQSYGAYVLRRIYSRHLATGLTLAVLLCLLLLAIPVAIARFWPTPAVEAALPTSPVVELKRYDLEQPKQPATPPTRQAVVVAPRNEVPTTVVKDDPRKPEEPAEVAPPAEEGVLTGPVAQAGAAGPGAPSGPATGPATDSNAVAPAPPAAPFVYAEVMPEFAGGPDALRQYLQRNMKYPRQALANAVSGKVFVAFTVQASGAISDVEILKGLGYGTEEEALRVVRSMPTWKAGRQNNHPVAVRYTLPITFRYE